MKLRELILTKCFAVYFLAFSMMISSCSEDDGVGAPPGPAPAVPPATTFELDLSQLPTEDGGRPAGRGETGTHWGQSVLGIGIWNIIIGAATVIPVTAFKASISQTPEFIGNATWQWTFDFNAAGIDHSAKLQGTLESDGVDWKMLLTKDGEFTDYEWYTGHSNLEGTDGDWTLNFGPDQSKPFMQIDWTKNADNSIADIRYTSIDPDFPGQNGYIEFGVNEEDPSYDAYYNLFDSQDSNLIEIQWNRDTKEGRLKNPKFFGDGDFRCWDSDLENIDC